MPDDPNNLNLPNHFSMVSSHIPGKGDRHDELLQVLKDAGYSPIDTQGSWQGITERVAVVPHSGSIQNMSDIENVAQNFGQEAVLHHSHGRSYLSPLTGGVLPAEGAGWVEAKDGEDHLKVGNKRVRFHLNDIYDSEKIAKSLIDRIRHRWVPAAAAIDPLQGHKTRHYEFEDGWAGTAYRVKLHDRDGEIVGMASYHKVPSGLFEERHVFTHPKLRDKKALAVQRMRERAAQLTGGADILHKAKAPSDQEFIFSVESHPKENRVNVVAKSDSGPQALVELEKTDDGYRVLSYVSNAPDEELRKSLLYYAENELGSIEE